MAPTRARTTRRTLPRTLHRSIATTPILPVIAMFS
jgi:hypothetical protein